MLGTNAANAFSLLDDENSSCGNGNGCASERQRHPALATMQADGVREHSPRMNEFSKFGWGGARANSGGARPGAGRPRKAVEATPQRAIQLRPLGPRWYVLRFAFGHELSAVREIVEGETRHGYPPRPGYRTEMPMQAVRKLRRGAWVVEQVPMMRPYGFVRLDAKADDWRAIVHIEGVLELFTTNSMTPVPLPENGMIERLIATAPERLHLKAPKMPARAVGSIVKVLEGPFTDHLAVVAECDGATTTTKITFFNRQLDYTATWSEFETVDTSSKRA